MANILQAIRNDTAEWHDRVELLVPVFKDNFTFVSYCALLEQFHGFYLSFEFAITSVAGIKQILPDWRERLRIPLLEQDLLWLGYTDSDLRALPICSRLPEINSLATAMGALYVAEGSTLGGQIIARHLAKALRLFSGAGASFFSCHGEDTGARWQTFTGALNQVAVPENERAIVRSSVDTFEALWRWLSQTKAKPHSPGRYERLEIC